MKPPDEYANMRYPKSLTPVLLWRTAAAATTELPFSSSSPLSFAQQFSDAITGSLNFEI